MFRKFVKYLVRYEAKKSNKYKISTKLFSFFSTKTCIRIIRNYRSVICFYMSTYKTENGMKK